MDKTQQAAQLRLAADLLETGHPWGFRQDKGPVTSYNSPLEVIQDGNVLIPLLAMPPDNRPLHNPDNLTAEQVGLGYRLVCYDDKTTEDKLEKWMSGEWVVVHTIGQLSFRHCQSTYRLPLHVPWPEAPDPYAELKKALAEGKVIQLETVDAYGKKSWSDIENPCFSSMPEAYRIKPDAPAFQLPPPPPGMQWHRTDGWEEGDLPQGWRPLVKGEESGLGCSQKYKGQWVNLADAVVAGPFEDCLRTRRPLTFTHECKTWTWHRPGDPMPCDGESMVHIITRDNDFSEEPSKSKDYEWDQIEGSCRFAEIIGWRYADEKKTVPLGPEDVKPFTVIRRKGEAQTWHWRTVSYVDAVKVTCGNRVYGWDELASSYERNESLPLTGKWNPSAWEPCSKPA